MEKQDLLKMCVDNKPLLKFVNKMYKKHGDLIEFVEELNSFWDVEMELYFEDPNNNDHFAIKDDALVDEELDEDGWRFDELDHDFAKYFGYYKWGKISLWDDKLLFLVRSGDKEFGYSYYFLILNYKLLESGYVETAFI